MTACADVGQRGKRKNENQIPIKCKLFNLTDLESQPCALLLQTAKSVMRTGRKIELKQKLILTAANSHFIRVSEHLIGQREFSSVTFQARRSKGQFNATLIERFVGVS